MSALALCARTIGERWRAWFGIAIGFVAFYYATQLVTVSARLGHFPNYVTWYDWPANVWRIVRSTPALADVPAIVADEWLVEIGYMNYDYGRGISEWSLEIIPAKLAVIALLGLMLAACLLLLDRARKVCPRAQRGAGTAAAGAGTMMVGIANVTMSWVSCCAAPTWVTGLSLMGVSTSSAFALVPYGGDLSLAGFAVLAATACFLARRCAAAERPVQEKAAASLAILSR